MRALVLPLILCLFSVSASASISAARLAYRNGDYKEAAALALAGVGDKDPAAMDLLGDLFREGLGVRRDKETAFGWYEKAAQLDYVPALYRVGVYAHEGFGTSRDAVRGLSWILRVPEIRRPRAQFDAAMLNWIGFRASEREDAHALFMMGKALQNGWGVEVDARASAELYAAAAREGHPLARINLGAMRMRGEGVGEDKRAALAQFEKAAEEGYAIAQYNFGLVLVRDGGPYRDLPRGKRMLEQAAAQGYKPAERELSR
jgi:TPR repeat protein